MAYAPSHNHASMLGTWVMCPTCRHPKETTKGVTYDGQGRVVSIWYLGCDCRPPSGVFKTGR